VVKSIPQKGRGAIRDVRLQSELAIATEATISLVAGMRARPQNQWGKVTGKPAEDVFTRYADEMSPGKKCGR